MNKLDQLKQMTEVVADTGDIEAIALYQPTDATTNPSLLLKAAALPRYSALLDEARHWAGSLEISSDERVSACSDRLAVLIGNEILKLIPGRVSTEVDARLSFDTSATVARARRIIAFYDDLEINPSRILIKIASTWEGIEAARILEREGINCNLTLLFSPAQAVAAAEAGAFLISPFVGRIYDWYKKHDGVDDIPADVDPGVVSVRDIYNYYKQNGYETVVMGASFRHAGQIEQLAGCDRLTVSPALLQQLSQDSGSLQRKLDPQSNAESPVLLIDGEPEFRFQLNNDPMATEKLAEGIRLFTADQIKLEKLLTETD